MSNPNASGGTGLTALGKLFSFLLVVGLLALGGWVVMNRMGKKADTPPAVANGGGGGGSTAGTSGGKTAAAFDMSDLEETQFSQPKLDPPGAYVPQNNVVDVEISKYPGYAGLIAANGGLEPSETSYFFTKHGFKVRIKVSEEESWSALNAGKMAASATTADVIPAYGRQFQVVVPAQIGYSRGADGIVVKSDIKKFNDLKGKTVASCQFTEADFLLRYLAREANIPVKMLADLSATPDPEAINVVYAKDGLAAGALFKKALDAGSDKLAGCVTWAPATTDIPNESKGKARLLVSNKNLLLVADVLIVNKGFAEKNPKMVEGLVDGLLNGNASVRDNPQASADVVGKAFGWNRDRTLAELQKVHLSNLPEQMAFFTSGITQGGSFASIFQSALETYATDFKDLLNSPVDSDKFMSLDALKKAEAAGTYKSQTAALKPLSATGGVVAETDPVLSKDIRFQFVPNEAALELKDPENIKNLDAIKRIIDVSPGSRILLVGHADNGKVADFRRQGGEALVSRMSLEAKDLSKKRANEIMSQMLKRFPTIEPKRFEAVGMGWDKPISTNGDLNRRVEVQWFTLE
jgi:NitT/TauT family transport system substrate-binding protein